VDLIMGWAETLAAAIGLKPWAILVFITVLLAATLDFLQRRLMGRLGKFVEDSKNLWDDALFISMRRPLTVLIWVIGITVAVELIPAGGGVQVISEHVIVPVRKIGVLATLGWFLMTFVSNIEANIIAKAQHEGRQVDRTTVEALGRIVQITILVTVFLVGLDTLGFSISGLMAAGGIGGLAVGFAAKDLLANFFGGLTVFADRPFSVGDWIVLKDKSIEGVVEKIGWRQTTIRKFDKRPVYVPNAIFTTASVENPSRMTHRRIYETIGLRYRDIWQMQAITGEVREMLQKHPEIDQSQTLMVNFNAFGASSVDFFIYCMTRTVNWQKYHEVKQDVLLEIMGIVERAGASIAFPTRTLNFDPVPQLAGISAAGSQTNGETNDPTGPS
jgi:MscS family membrane protein